MDKVHFSWVNERGKKGWKGIEIEMTVYYVDGGK